jgi:hypothetical protein
MVVSSLANYYARFFLGCDRFSRKRYIVVPDYVAVTLAPAGKLTTTPATATVRLMTSSPFVLGYLNRQGFIRQFTELGTAVFSVPLLQGVYREIVKPFRQVILPLSGGPLVANSALFLASYPVQPRVVYTALFSGLLVWRFSVPFFSVYGALLRPRPLLLY